MDCDAAATRVASRRWPPPRSSQPDGGLHRHSGAQTMVAVELRESDSDRQSLDDLHVVTGRVLRREQAVLLAAGAADTLDRAGEVAPDRVDVDSRALARMHFSDLRFLE